MTDLYVSSLPSVWGKDADEWNPMRFIDGHIDNEIKLGMFGNLYVSLTFSRVMNLRFLASG